MKYKGFVVIVVLVMMLIGASQSFARSTIQGQWRGVDIDGSTETIRIGGGRGDTARMNLHDDVATSACPVTHGKALASGTGTFDGSVVSVEWTVRCPGEGTEFTAPATYTYDAATDTLTSWLGVVYERVTP